MWQVMLIVKASTQVTLETVIEKKQQRQIIQISSFTNVSLKWNVHCDTITIKMHRLAKLDLAHFFCNSCNVKNGFGWQYKHLHRQLVSCLLLSCWSLCQICDRLLTWTNVFLHLLQRELPTLLFGRVVRYDFLQFFGEEVAPVISSGSFLAFWILLYWDRSVLN